MAAIATPIAPAFPAVEEESGFTVRLVESPARILSVNECQTDHTALRRIIDNTQWRLATANSCREALHKLRQVGAVVVFCESSLPDGNWKDVLDVIPDLEAPPLLVVTSRLADAYLWSEVLNLGGYDVLAKPFVEDEVLRVLASVWSHRANPLPLTRVFRAAS